LIKNTPFGQQMLPKKRFNIDKDSTAKLTAGIGLVVFILGFVAFKTSEQAAQIRVVYNESEHGFSNLASERPMGTRDEEIFKTCKPAGNPKQMATDTKLTCKVKVPRDMKSPILVYYGIGTFYQNFATYIKSEVPSELVGKKASDSVREFRCRGEHTRERSGKQIVPCGEKATSLFNDRIDIEGNEIDRTNVAWPSDVARYHNPKDYLDRPKTMWMNDLFPKVVNKTLGVQTEAFAQWMRPAALGRVWNNYGWLQKELKKGENLTLNIHSEFRTPDGTSKMFVLTERNWLGGRHNGLGVALMLCGGVCFGMMIMACFMDQIKSGLQRGGRMKACP